jgi:hypothetical protein
VVSMAMASASVAPLFDGFGDDVGEKVCRDL